VASAAFSSPVGSDSDEFDENVKDLVWDRSSSDPSDPSTSDLPVDLSALPVPLVRQILYYSQQPAWIRSEMAKAKRAMSLDQVRLYFKLFCSFDLNMFVERYETYIGFTMTFGWNVRRFERN
jgi:hypothetical protein